MRIEIQKVNDELRENIYQRFGTNRFPSIRQNTKICKKLNARYGDLLFIQDGKSLKRYQMRQEHIWWIKDKQASPIGLKYEETEYLDGNDCPKAEQEFLDCFVKVIQ
jgi:hypothetical protein